jgi:hypothetical protein
MLPETRARGRTDRRLYGPPADVSIRITTLYRGKNATIADVFQRYPGGNGLGRSACASFAADVHRLAAALATIRITGDFRHLLLGGETEPLFL